MRARPGAETDGLVGRPRAGAVWEQPLADREPLPAGGLQDSSKMPRVLALARCARRGIVVQALGFSEQGLVSRRAETALRAALRGSKEA